MTFSDLVYLWIAIGILIFPLTLLKTAPYGRHSTTTWGPLIGNKMGWVIMELPALILVPLLFVISEQQSPTMAGFYVLLWAIHYANRTVVYPNRIKTSGKKIPLAIVSFAFVFNLINGFLNGYYFAHFPTKEFSASIRTIHFWLGLSLFLFGLISNWLHDNKLIALRKNHSGYQIPRGGLFRWVSCPNHFSEIIEWCGFALMTLSPAALSFAIWTLVNLLPRALDHHRWYRKEFEDYPIDRKAVIPFIL